MDKALKELCTRAFHDVRSRHPKTPLAELPLERYSDKTPEELKICVSAWIRLSGDVAESITLTANGIAVTIKIKGDLVQISGTDFDSWYMNYQLATCRMTYVMKGIESRFEI